MMTKSHRARLLFVAGLFTLTLAILMWRMLDLMILNRQFLKEQGDARSVRLQTIFAYRGMIMDRNGAPLAVSTPVQSAWINPQEFSPTLNQLKKLSAILGIPTSTIQRITHEKDKEFVFIKRQLPPTISARIEALKIKGLHFQQEFKRYYPESENIAPLLGFTNIDDVGIEGIELAYQEWLMGAPGKRRIIKDRTGRVIEELGIISEPRPGHDLSLSIDRRIQYLAYHELELTLQKFSARSGSIVVVDTQSGEILAAANAPSFNPNARERYSRSSYRNKAITDTFEPGSVIKPFSIASALSSGAVKPDMVFDTRPSWMTVHGHLIRDVHNYGVLNVTEVLQHSSNVGVTKMILLSPPEQFINLLHNCGFGQRTTMGFPGESDGSIVQAKDANPFVLATLSFGYGISTTVLQLAQAYTIFANHGILIPVTLLHGETVNPGKRVLDQKTADILLEMLKAVVLGDGSGKAARIPGYLVAGKTGTARIAGKHGYEEKRYISSFAGIAPASHPRLVVVVVINEPRKNGYYAAAVAAPLFAKVMAGALRILDIPPDDVG